MGLVLDPVCFVLSLLFHQGGRIRRIVYGAEYRLKAPPFIFLVCAAADASPNAQSGIFRRWVLIRMGFGLDARAYWLEAN